MSDLISQFRLRLAPGTAGRKWLKRSAWALATLYVILGTYVWVILYGLFIAFVAPEMPQSKFRETMWCKPGDWVLDTFQPMVSDARMIRHLNANRAEMEKAALMTSNGTDVAHKSGLTPEFKILLKSIDIEDSGIAGSWPTNPYDINRVLEQERCVRDAPTLPDRGTCFGSKRLIVTLKPDFGRNWGQHFCTDNRHSNKGYMYFPAPAPRIEGGKILGQISLNGSYDAKGVLVPHADRNLDGGTIVRQIDAHWFIYRN